VERGKGHSCACSKGLEKCKVEASRLHEGLGVNNGNYKMVCDLLEWEGKLVDGDWFTWQIRWQVNGNTI
jgi:hypothetical protein